MKVLLTGASGFVGSHLTRHLVNENQIEKIILPVRSVPSVETIERWSSSKKIEVIPYIDLSDCCLVERLLKEEQPDAIIHLAANSVPKPTDPAKMIQDNVITTTNLAHFSPTNCRFLLASSVLVYGNMTSRADEHHPTKPTSVYGASKLASEGIVSAYTSQGQIKGCSLRMCATIGKGLTHGILYDFIRKARSSDPIFPVIGDKPGSCKPFTHVDDVCSAFILMLNNDFCTSYNVCPEDEINVQQIANLVLQETGANKEIEWGTKTWAGDNKLVSATNQRIKYRGWKPKYKTSIEAMTQGIKDNL